MGKEFAKLVGHSLAPEILACKNSAEPLEGHYVGYTGSGAGTRSAGESGGREHSTGSAMPAPAFPDRGLHMPNGWNEAQQHPPQGSTPRSGSRPAPSHAVRATCDFRPRMESRMRGNSHVRFGAGDEGTCLGDGVRRFIPTLPKAHPPSPSRHRLGHGRGQVQHLRTGRLIGFSHVLKRCAGERVPRFRIRRTVDGDHGVRQSSPRSRDEVGRPRVDHR